MSDGSLNIVAEDRSAETRAQSPDASEFQDARLHSIQPGGGLVMKLELLWGRGRRWYLKRFRPGYVARMQRLRRGEQNGCPHEVLDPRDLKFYQNQDGYWWDAEDDPFTWRDRLPFARAGLAELVVCSALTFGGAAVLGWLGLAFGWSGLSAWIGVLLLATLVVIGVLIAWFFRDPQRRIPDGTDVVVAPADGKIVAIEELEHDEFLGGPAVQIGIFLSIFNVHINRMPIAGRVVGLHYQPGKCLNALRAESARENEQLAIHLEQDTAGGRRMIVRQITGAIARRIVCWLKAGDVLQKGRRLGMIKLGSRTELVLPLTENLVTGVRIGQTVHAGSSILARYEPAKSRGT